MFTYNINLIPACPVVSIRIKDEFRHFQLPPVSMLIDTGADYSCIPASSLQHIPGVFYEGCTIEDYGGIRRRGKLVHFNDTSIEFLDPNFNIILSRYYGDLSMLILESEDGGLLGRDILNKHICELNGPNLQFKFQV